MDIARLLYDVEPTILVLISKQGATFVLRVSYSAWKNLPANEPSW